MNRFYGWECGEDDRPRRRYQWKLGCVSGKKDVIEGGLSIDIDHDKYITGYNVCVYACMHGSPSPTGNTTHIRTHFEPKSTGRQNTTALSASWWFERQASEGDRWPNGTIRRR